MRSTSNPTPSRHLPGREIKRGALAFAILVSAAVVLSAPFLGQLRGMLRSAFPGHFVTIVGGSVAIAVIAALTFALGKVRERRGLRYGAIAAAFACAIAYSIATRTGIPEVDVVERVHFVEYGAIAFLFYRSWRPLGDTAAFILPALAAMLVGTCDEWLQWFIPNRVGEARDVFLNLVAIACGLTFGAALEPPVGFTPTLGHASRRLVARGLVIFIAVFAVFLHVIHVGRLTTDAALGAFKSRYSTEELRRLSDARKAEWSVNPPLVLRRLSREDQYLDEGLWHIRERNEMWAAANYDAAWFENEILERYFAPVLDTKTYATPALSRWPAEQKANAARLRTNTANDYMSKAEPYPLVVMPKWQFWGIVGAVMLGVLLWSRGGISQEIKSPGE